MGGLWGQPQEVGSLGSAPFRKRKQQGQVPSGVSPAFRACFQGRRWHLLRGSGLDSRAVVLRLWHPDQQHLERPDSQGHPRLTDSETLGLGLKNLHF